MSAWYSTTLGDLCADGGGGIQTGPFGSQLHASDYVEEGTPVVMPQNIRDNYVEADGIARISGEELERLERYQLLSGDIVYSRRGDVERRALIRPENAGWLCGTGCLRVRLGDGGVHDATFVSYALGLKSTREWIVRHAVGATMLNLNTSILSAVPLRVPNLEEQQAIAEVLGALDDKIAANTRLMNLTRELLTAYFEALGIDAAPSFDSHAVYLEDLVQLNPKVPKPDSTSAVYLEMKNVPEQEMTVHSWSFREPKGGVRFQNGDTVMARITPCLQNGKTAYIDFLDGNEVGVGSTEYIVMRARPGVPTALPYFLAKSPRFRERAIRSMVGTSGRQRLAAKDVAPHQVWLPGPERLDEFGTVSSIMMKRVKGAVDESRSLAATRDALLPLLMSGKVTVKDAESVVEEAI